MRNGDFSDSEHIGWIDADAGLLSKVFGLALNYKQRKGDPLYIRRVLLCWQILEEDVPFVAHHLPSSI